MIYVWHNKSARGSRKWNEKYQGTTITGEARVIAKNRLTQIELHGSNYTDRITRIIASTGLAEPGRPEFQVVVPPRLAGG